MDRLKVQEILDLVKRIKGDAIFYDLHMHPFEVMFSSFAYRPSPHDKDLFSTDSSQYVSPQTTDMKLNHSMDVGEKRIDETLRAKLCLFNARRFYAHTGAKVFADQMNLCGIDRALLLPVMAAAESGDGQLEAVAQMFNDKRFLSAYCVPNNIPNAGVEQAVRQVAGKFGVRALKIHPSITGIDLSHSAGIDRVEHLLAAAEKCGLFVMIHGGLSPDCQNSAAVRYGEAKYLLNIDWSLTKATVVIAHAGLFGHSDDDCRKNVWPIMEKMFEQHDHLAVDTSGLFFNPLCLLLRSFDQKKIYFGSDALYEKPWMAMVKLWCALLQTAENCEEALVEIVGTNSSKLLAQRTGSDPKERGEVEPLCRCNRIAQLLPTPEPYPFHDELSSKEYGC
ncbi:MAG: amidohydrolase family protein [Desulfuromonadales bacterium]|nr:amidohydrolase family protein [Desulfuromonadales bacterium]